ncbi:MAG: hypothetical protein J6Z80_03320, partial [Clostridia bacterium]|nr:hypothetical protein [Clostridia bacterium]
CKRPRRAGTRSSCAIKTARMTYSFENTMYGTLGPERTVWDAEALETMGKAAGKADAEAGRRKSKKKK